MDGRGNWVELSMGKKPNILQAKCDALINSQKSLYVFPSLLVNISSTAATIDNSLFTRFFFLFFRAPRYFVSLSLIVRLCLYHGTDLCLFRRISIFEMSRIFVLTNAQTSHLRCLISNFMLPHLLNMSTHISLFSIFSISILWFSQISVEFHEFQCKCVCIC